MPSLRLLTAVVLLLAWAGGARSTKLPNCAPLPPHVPAGVWDLRPDVRSTLRSGGVGSVVGASMARARHGVGCWAAVLTVEGWPWLGWGNSRFRCADRIS